MKIRFISQNPNKIKEVKQLFHDTKVELLPVSLQIEEIQSDNMQKLVEDKILRAFSKIGKPVFVEHTGLHIESLNGFPGGLTQVFWDTLKAEKFCEILGRQDKTAVEAKTIIGYCDGKKLHFFEGSIIGRISEVPKGDRVFEWDCVFIPNGHMKTFAEMGDEKNSISMRKIAFDKFKVYLNLIG